MRRTIASVTTPGRWRRRRAVRIGLAAALVVAAPFVDRSGAPDPADPTAPAAAAGPGDDPARGPVRVVPVPLADPTVADLLRPGDLVDLVGTTELAPGQPPALVAHAARVRDAPVGRSGARSLLVEVPAADAARLAATAAGTPLAVVVHG
ncbi:MULTISPECIES: hypothetical protein [Dietzia]|jgi:hypothetical protein|uniref:Flp pilus assembly protein RcpC/CpaB domain-containing protein n=1 Tax=Dietzia maris TaxID=37915 RepID=A0ABT8H1L8_9ACTN|nr:MULTISPECIES: hypothetical protein [Dietzia]MCZ4541547.1 hypothetical protein [Dietzia maris]MCZ4655950.1 hypothetical protein [Dietzia kunjamensis]MDJ0422508.1 hypothetical protein [Dietzia kunjamensis]MDN4506361.1 hypothetical protein [Dietzia maris]MDV3354834.1 hypothetical protein [Dietzia sp. IN118]